MDLSIFLAKVIGLYLVITISATLINYRSLKPIITQMIGNEVFMLFSGIMALMLGLLLVVGHNIWEMNWRVLITLIAWITLIKGLTRLFFIKGTANFARKVYGDDRILYITAGIFLIIGVYLCYVGFITY